MPKFSEFSAEPHLARAINFDVVDKKGMKGHLFVFVGWCKEGKGLRMVAAPHAQLWAARGSFYHDIADLQSHHPQDLIERFIEAAGCNTW